MATTKPFAINTGAPISGTDQVGNIAIGTTTQEYSLGPGGVTWYMGPDEEPGFIIAEDAGNGEPRFWRSGNKTDQSFLDLINSLSVRLGFSPFSSISDAKTWLTANGYYYSSVDRNESILIPTDDGSGNWIFYVINSTKNTIATVTPPEILSRGDWSLSDVYPIWKGYGVIFTKGNDRKVWFLDSEGSYRDTYTANSNSNNYQSTGSFFYYNDITNKKYMVFDGSSVRTIDYSGMGNVSLEMEWYWDAYTSGGSYVISTRNYDTNEKYATLYSANGGSTVIQSIDTNTYNYYIFLGIASNVISVLKQQGSQPISLQLWSDTGSILQDIDLTTGDYYNSWDLQIYGINSVYWIFWNNNDNNVDWKIYNYESTTNNLLTWSQPNGGNFTHYQTWGNSYWSPNNTDRNTLAVMFYGDSGTWTGTQPGNNNFWAGDYVTLVWFCNGANLVRNDATNAGSPDVAIGMYDVRYSNVVYVPVIYLSGSYPLQIVSLGSTSPNPVVNTVAADSSTVYDQYTYVFGNSYIIVLWADNTYTSGEAWLIREDGVTTDSVHVGSGFYSDRSYNTFYLHDDTAAYYVNTVSDGFAALGRVYQNSYSSNNYYRGPGVFHKNGVQVLLDNANDPGLEHAFVRILTPTGISSEIQLEPNNGSYNIQTGEDHWMYVFDNVSSGYAEGYLYDFDGNQISDAHLPPGPSFNQTWAIQHRYGWYMQDTGSTRTWVMLTPTGSYTQEIDLNNTWYTPNDKFSWC